MFDYAICNETFQGWEWEPTCRQIAECGYRHVEVAPFTLTDDVRTLESDTRRTIRSGAETVGLSIVGLHWLLVSPPGLSITSDDPSLRTETADYLKALAAFCSDLGGKTMVLGSPSQRRLPTSLAGAGSSALDLAQDRLREVLTPALELCSRLGVTICLEPLPSPEANFILTMSEAADFIKAVDHPCLKTMLDIKSASSEIQSIPELIDRYSDSIHHVHANDANRRGPGFGETDFVPVLRSLLKCKYTGPVSIEVFDYTPDPVTIASRSLEYLQHCETHARTELEQAE